MPRTTRSQRKPTLAQEGAVLQADAAPTLPMPNQASPQKRLPKKRRKAERMSEAEDEPPSKRQASDITQPDVPGARVGLQKRHGRPPGKSANPAGIPIPAKKQTASEKREAKRAAAVAAAGDAKRILAQLQLEEEEDAARSQMNSQRRLSAVIQGSEGATMGVDTDGGESFGAVSSSSDSTVFQVKKASKNRKTVRGDVNIIVGALHGEAEGGGKNKGSPLSRFSAVDVIPKSYANSGLRPNPTKNLAQIGKDGPVGGFTDEDVFEERPAFQQAKKLGPPSKLTLTFPQALERDRGGQSNELVRVVGASRPGHDQVAGVAKHELPKKLKKATTMEKPAVKGKKAAAIPVAEEIVIADTDRSSMFMDDPSWAAVFIPSLTHALYVSRQAFREFKVDSPEFLVAVQLAFDAAFPNVEYTIMKGDPMITKACSRMNSRKSKIAKAVLDDVAKIFEQSEYKNNVANIKEYALWALKPEGPVYYAEPRPLNYIVPKNDANYVGPKGLLQSDIIINTARRFLRHADDSALEPKLSSSSPPKALYALILLAAERAFKAYRLAEGRPLGKLLQFSHDNYWKALNDFMTKVDTVSERRWKEILGAVQAAPEPDGDEDSNLANEAILSAYRRDAFVTSSPAKAEGV